MIKVKVMSKMTTNSQLSITEPNTQKQTKQTTRTRTESQKWGSHGREGEKEEWEERYRE